jgi:endonuclease/exonuclease/phosphatase family metal-dependent hydrolase
MLRNANKRKALRITVAGVVVFCLSAFTAQAQESKRVLSFMTRNMDAGTDLNLIFAFYPDVPAGVSATLAQVVSTDPPSRANRLADEIRTSQPDLIALQEVTEWRRGPCGSTTVGAGFADVWRQFNPPGTGFTWPLYYEDLASGPAIPNERIDLIFTRGIRAVKADETGLRAPWASDHAGVVAMLQIGK